MSSDKKRNFHAADAIELNTTLDSIAQIRNAGDRRTCTVELTGDEYQLETPLQLQPELHDNVDFLAADDCQPKIHSLRRIDGWESTSLNNQTVWRAKLPANLHPRRLFANRELRTCARFPKFDPVHRHEEVFHLRPYPEGEVPGLHWGTHRLPTDDIDPQWQGLYDAEAVLLHFWVAERIPHLRYIAESKELVGSRRSIYRLTEGTQPLPVRYYLDNLLDALTEPGEWCFRASTCDLFYLPHADESPEETVIEVPALHTLVEIHGYGYGQSKEQGSPLQHQPVRGLRLEGITFTGSDWLPPTGTNLGVDHNVPNTGHPLAGSVQGEFDACATIDIHTATDIAFARCTFEHTGAHAVRIGEGCSNVRILDCQFRELGGGALIAHGTDLNGAPAGRTRDIYFLNNTVFGIGRQLHGACGVLGGAVERMIIAHNHICDTFYSGISLGWTWGYAETVSKDHIVENNIIENVAQGLLNDLGGIYLVGRNTGTIIRRNIVRNVRCANFGARGIYLDEGCCHVLVEQNLVVDAGESCLNMHYGRGHLIRHNLLCRSEAGISLSRDDGNGTFTALQNIFWQTDFPYWGGYAMPNLAETTVQANSNCFYPQTRESFELHHPSYLHHPRVPFADWEAAGNDCNCLFADPALIDPANGDYRLSPDSPALDLGLVPWDHAGAGPCGEDVFVRYSRQGKSTRSEF